MEISKEEIYQTINNAINQKRKADLTASFAALLGGSGTIIGMACKMPIQGTVIMGILGFCGIMYLLYSASWSIKHEANALASSINKKAEKNQALKIEEEKKQNN